MAEPAEVAWIHDALNDPDERIPFVVADDPEAPIAYALEPLVEFCPVVPKKSPEWWAALNAARAATSE